MLLATCNPNRSASYSATLLVASYSSLKDNGTCCRLIRLPKRPDVIVTTPGRLMHHLAEVDEMSLRPVEYVVFDEADHLFEMGSVDQLQKILAQLSVNRQTLSV